MLLSDLKRKATKHMTRMQIKFSQKSFDGLPYLWQRNGSDRLLIVFSAFTGDKRRFNYVTSFKGLKCDKLFLLDPWGCKGSYNLYENGQNYPEQITKRLLTEIVNSGGYKYVYAAGTSKGGTEAIYFGLPLNVDIVFTGACQYNLGTYLGRAEFRDIFEGMMGKDAGEQEVNHLNELMYETLRTYKGNKTVVHVFYSKKELTYERQIINLIQDLKENNILFEDVESDFEKHEDVAGPFVQYVTALLSGEILP